MVQLRTLQNATVGSALVQIVAQDDDVDQNGAVRYRLRADPSGHWKTFNLQPVSGILELNLPLDRKKRKIYDVSRVDGVVFEDVYRPRRRLDQDRSV